MVSETVVLGIHESNGESSWMEILTKPVSSLNNFSIRSWKLDLVHQLRQDDPYIKSSTEFGVIYRPEWLKNALTQLANDIWLFD